MVKYRVSYAKSKRLAENQLRAVGIPDYPVGI